MTSAVKPFLISLLCLFVSMGLCLGLPGDAELANRLVGEWQGGRHAEQYLNDGTWRLDPAQGTTHGTWRVESGRLTKTWQLLEPPGELTRSYEVLVLDAKKLVLRDDRGTIFTSTRMTQRP
jgi:hypothetical protein